MLEPPTLIVKAEPSLILKATGVTVTVGVILVSLTVIVPLVAWVVIVGGRPSRTV